MLSMFGLLKKNLELQGKLPDKWKTTPVASGCVFYLDAINNTGEGHDNSVTTWKNLVGSTNAKSFRNATWSDDHLRIKSGGCILQPIQTKSFCMELLVSLNAFNTKFDENIAYFASNVQSGGFGLHISTSNIIGSIVNFGSSYAAQFSSMAELDTKYLISVNFDADSKIWTTLVNNENKVSEKVSSNYVTSAAPMVLGYNPRTDGSPELKIPQYVRDFNVYSVRLYNRALTKDELLRNLDYDRERYNF